MGVRWNIDEQGDGLRGRVVRRAHGLRGLLGSVLVLGCTPPPPMGGPGSDTSTASTGITSGESSTGSPSSHSGPLDASTGSGTLGGTSSGASTTSGVSTSSDASTTSDDTGMDMGSVCDPQPEGVCAYPTLNVVDDDLADVLVDGMCDVTTIEPSEDDLRIVLQCDPSAIELVLYNLSAEPVLPFGVGQSLHVRADHIIPIDGAHDIFLAISEPGGELLFGLWQWHTVAGLDLHTEWYAPLDLELVYGVCEPEPYVPPDNGNTFIITPCGVQDERLAVDVGVGGAPPQRMYDDSRATVVGYDVWVITAKHFIIIPEEQGCSGGQGDGVRVLMIASP
jgi:hypothetical protein